MLKLSVKQTEKISSASGDLFNKIRGTDEPLVSYYNAAYGYINKYYKALPDFIKEDFPSYVVIEKLKGRNLPYDFYLADYLREVGVSTRVGSREGVQAERTEAINLMRPIETIRQEVGAQDDYIWPMLDTIGKQAKLDKRELVVIKALYIGRSLKAIGKALRITESRVCQIRMDIKNKIERYLKRIEGKKS